MDQHIETLTGRFIDGAGFANTLGGSPRPDATCWAILALQSAQAKEALVQNARSYLASLQSAGGCVPITSEHPDAYWPTSLAVLAWHGAEEQRASQDEAIRFLLEYAEILTAKAQRKIIGYDATLKGWPWTANTFSWVEPTALAMIALRAAGHGDHQRMRDSVKFLMDRQLPDGGWNVGCTLIFGHALRPMPENTGMALQALSGLVPRKDLEKSIRYLDSRLQHLHTPFTLGWSLLGLDAWAEPVPNRLQMVTNVLQRQDKSGAFDTTALSVLLIAHYCQHGLIDFLDGKH